MTVQTGTPPRLALDRLVHCSKGELGTRAWWTCVNRCLTELREELAADDISGLVEQINLDAPHYAAAANRLSDLGNSVAAQALEVSQLARTHRRDPAAAHSVRSAVEQLLRRVRHLYRLSDELLLDAYEMDLGGD